ncbi:hypothetical protein [Virgibacillus sp. Bac330]|uniref:hypothetical protein n=1 Tax=Virgibacillus sp. Bac330 TaxID=2419841 RepID=UPI000EF44E6F|nr:hypothetical protein [Virgibacillus sp. Bac330]
MAGGNIKKYRRKGYESLNREMLQDTDNLSLEAIGLLANLISMPDSWEIKKTALYKFYGKNGRRSVEKAWNQLVENNYIVQLRKRTGRTFEYIYYVSQEKFQEDDIKEIEKMEGCSIWDGKLSTQQEENRNYEEEARHNSDSSTVQNAQSKFGLYILDSPKCTVNKLTNNYLDTLDTNIDTKNHDENITHEINPTTDEEKEQLKKAYMEKGFYENSERVPERLANMLKAFSADMNQAQKYYEIILIAKKRVEKEVGFVIWLEQEHELEYQLINAFSRAIRQIEQQQTVENGDGYIYKTIYNVLLNELSTRSRNANQPDTVYYDWLEEGKSNEVIPEWFKQQKQER